MPEGGWIGLLLARAMPERMAGLVTVAAAPDFTERGFWPGFSEAERAALLRDGRVLLVHRHPLRENYPDCWDLPGGHVESGETPTEAARRAAEAVPAKEEVDTDALRAELPALRTATASSGTSASGMLSRRVQNAARCWPLAASGRANRTPFSPIRAIRSSA